MTRVLLEVGEANAPAIALYTRKEFVPDRQQNTLQRDHVRQIQLGINL